MTSIFPHKKVRIPHKKSCIILLPHKNEDCEEKSHKLFFTCDFCEKKFTRRDNLERHIVKYCKKKSLSTRIDKITSDLQLVVENQKQAVEEHRNHVESLNKEREKLYSVIEKINNSGNVVNNTYNQNNQIIINSYGCENLHYIKEYLHELIKNTVHIGTLNLLKKYIVIRNIKKIKMLN